MQAGDSSLEEQRKLVTVLFADLVGFTAIAEKMDPEDTREILNLSLTIAREMVRRHALIRYEPGDMPGFKIADLDSSNGTFLNGEKLTGEKELLPEDLIELGKGGPKFLFDVSPRPKALATRTRVISGVDSAATRVLQAADAAKAVEAGKTGATAKITGAGEAMAPKGVGKETVQRMLGEERKNTNRTWAAVAAGVLVFLGIGGAALYWRQQMELDDVRVQAARDADRLRTEAQNAQTAAQANVAKQLGLSAQDIAQKYANATAQISFQWRVYDSLTGRPVFHKVVTCRFNNETKRWLAYVRLANGNILPWLTTEDEEGRNISIASSPSTGSGFVVAENGFILTNKHVASGWETSFDDYKSIQVGQLYEYDGRNARSDDCRNAKPFTINHSDWLPTFGQLFETLQAVPLGAARSFVGKNDYLEVRFPGSSLSVAATLVRVSKEADAALIKIDTPQTLAKVELAADDKLTVGENTYVLGYPGVSVKTYVETLSNERGAPRVTRETIPQATITEGVLSNLPAPQKLEGERRIISQYGDVFQLAINTTGSGNSGGPVFNAQGKVIGLFTYGWGRGGTNVSGAIPIKYGRDLLQPQRAQ